MRDIEVSQPIVDDLRRRLRCDDLFDWIEHQAEQLATLGFDDSTGRTRLTRKLFRARSVFQVELTKALNQHACIIEHEGHYKIQYSPDLPNSRLRFALAHELGHTFFFRGQGSVASISNLQGGGEHRTIEALCDFFARALLLPRTPFWSKVETFNFDSGPKVPLHRIPELAEGFDVAEQAVARRMIFDVFEGYTTVLCIKKKKPKDANSARWRTAWCALSADVLTNKPTGWRIALDHHGRLIPEEIIPDISSGSTHQVMIDGRWHAAVKPRPPKDSRKPLSFRSALAARPALVARCGSEHAPTMFIAM